jgi:hypothetical protein
VSESEETAEEYVSDVAQPRYPMPPPPPPVLAPIIIEDDSERSVSTTPLQLPIRKRRRKKKSGPETDFQAYQLLYEIERLNIANIGKGVVAVYNNDEDDAHHYGLWRIDDGQGNCPLDPLCSRNSNVLGEYYGERNSGVKRLIEKSKRYHQKPCNWHLGLDTQLVLGELPLFDGILNVVTHKFTKYSSDKMCTVKMNMNTTEYLECCTDEDLAEVRRILRQMFPEEALYNCVMSRVVLGVLYHRNVHRGILILYGDGANGKTVLIKILRIILGDLMTTLSMNVLKETADSGGDKPLSWPKMLQGPRTCIFDEMNGNLGCALNKKIRGDDIFESREQHSAKQNTTSLTAFPILFGNDPPQCPKADQALSIR